jgi:membrane protein
MAVREFGDDQCTDGAAALTYYAILAIFPAGIALVSLLGVVGQTNSSVNTVIDVLRPLVSADTLDSVRTALEGVASSPGVGIGLVVGVLGALWSASGWVSAFGRAMNRIYECDEGRPFWKLRPWMFLVTLVSILLVAAILVMVVVSGSLATSIGDQLGVGSQALLVWRIAKWPAVAVLAVVLVAFLYWATPNVRPEKFRLLSPGAVTALAVWVAASVGFAFYVARFASYDRTYGSLAGVVVTLLFLWISHLALLFGAELDSELERRRELRAGLPAEQTLQLPPRDTRTIHKTHRKRRKNLERGRAVRMQALREQAHERYGERRVPADGDDAHDGSTTTATRDYEEARR